MSEPVVSEPAQPAGSLPAGLPRPPRLAGRRRVLSEIAAGAEELDRRPAFPTRAFAGLAGAGLLGATLAGPAGSRISFAQQLELIEQVARADGSVGRILDGHFNAVERLELAGALDPGDRSAIAAGALLLGVWGADPAPGEGEPARLGGPPGAVRLDGVKTFCSGAGGVQRALVVAQDAAGQRRLAYVDLARGVTIDRAWYRAFGLRASESHRVVFDQAPVLAVLGGPGEILREPWFSRDAIRTGATWAGIAGGVLDEALRLLGARGEPGETTALAVGRMLVAAGTIDRWIDHAGRVGQDVEAPLAATAIQARWAIAAAAREIAAEAALACGSRPLATGGALSRGRRDLDLFLLQHRLEPPLARHGAGAIAAGPPARGADR